uniref:Class I SAM-dependent methyltransferase n=1 Tax=candidate division WWE3 bacterium TaxID=2053526 RepID=A0A7C4Y2I2_UNCKA
MKCFVCGNQTDFTALSPEFTDTNNHLCMECGLVFIPREGDKFAKYYKEDGYYTESPNIAARPFFISKSLLTELAKEKIKTIESLTPKNLIGLKVIDVGCGYGEILYVLKRDYKCEVLGIEPSKLSAQIGREMFRIEIKDILLDEYKTEEKFDLVMCNHTLEHLENPIEFLRQLKNLLKDGGQMYIEVPNILCPSGGFDLKTFLYFEHLQTFSATTLARLVETVGLKVKSYNDKRFLEFVLVKSTEEPAIIPEITPSEVLRFLKKYKTDYTIFNRVGVYFRKAVYLARFIYHKILDLLNG